jgi:hypothetical protein
MGLPLAKEPTKKSESIARISKVFQFLDGNYFPRALPFFNYFSLLAVHAHHIIGWIVKDFKQMLKLSVS